MRGLRPILICASLLALGAGPPTAGAAGITTHAFMADKAREYVAAPGLRKLLAGERSGLISGGAWPDSGYAAASYPGGAFGEATHWERFTNAFVKQLRTRCGAASLADPKGPCAQQVAFLMGVAAHGVGDEMWDWLFEPQMPDHGENPVHPFLRTSPLSQLATVFPLDQVNTPEFAMDMVAIVAHARILEIPLMAPPVADLISAYSDVYAEEGAIPGRSRTLGRVPGRDAIFVAHAIITAVLAVERVAVVSEYPRVLLTMPWAAAHMYSESGGVVDSAQAIAGYMDALWAKLTGPAGADPTPKVAAVHPEAGERGVPFAWPDPAGKDFSGPVDGLAENRIIAVLSNALPYPGTGFATLPANGFRLFDEVTGDPVPPAAGFPQPGPYGAGDGTHSMMFWPAHDLQPCRWYVAKVSTAVLDDAGTPLPADHSWRFQTRAAADPAPAGCLSGKDPAGLPGAGTSGPATLGPTVTDLVARLAGN